MKIVKSKDKEWLGKEGYSKKILIDEVKSKGVVMQDVKIKPGEIAKSHYHKKQTEIFYFLNENGKWLVNGAELEVKTGDVLVIEPFDKHEVSNNTSEDYLFIAFKYDYDENDLYWVKD